MADNDGLPSADQVAQVLGYVPQIEAYFRRGPAEMPPALGALFAEHRLTLVTAACWPSSRRHHR